jgi:hypothetical protein
VASAGEAIRQGEIVALEERRRLGLGSAPIGNIAEMIATKEYGRPRPICLTACPVYSSIIRRLALPLSSTCDTR